MTTGHLIKTAQKVDPNKRINLYDNYLGYHIGYRILFTYAYIYLYEQSDIGMYIQKMMQDGTININGERKKIN